MKLRGSGCLFVWLTSCFHSHTGSPGSRRGTYSQGRPAIMSPCVFSSPLSLSASLCITATLPVLCCVCLPGQSIKMFIRGRPITMYVPSNIQNYEDLKMELPSDRLELDWVYPSTMPQQPPVHIYEGYVTFRQC